MERNGETVIWSDPKVKHRVRTAGIWAALLVAYILIGIDDWGRDWVEHEATLRFEPQQPRVARLLAAPPGHPNHVSISEWSAAVQWAGKRIKNLDFAGEAADDDTLILKFVRTHRLLRLRDDLTVKVTRVGSEQRIETHAKARLGIADLGRNPKTIRRLYAELEDVLAESNLVSAIGL